MHDDTLRSSVVLIVEDEPALLSVVSRHLTSQGFIVMEASCVQQAREAVEKRLPDVILLDVLLPDGSGFDLCEELRQHTFAPIIYITALAHDQDVVKGLAVGGDDYLAKPFSLDVLTAHINAQLRRYSLPTSTRIDLPPLHVDFVSGKVTLEGMVVDLTKRELQLLSYFASHLGRGVTQEELLIAVWDDRSGVPTNTVRQHISALRRKLGLDSKSAFELVCTREGRYVFQQVRFATTRSA